MMDLAKLRHLKHLTLRRNSGYIQGNEKLRLPSCLRSLVLETANNMTVVKAIVPNHVPHLTSLRTEVTGVTDFCVEVRKRWKILYSLCDGPLSGALVGVGKRS